MRDNNEAKAARIKVNASPSHKVDSSTSTTKIVMLISRHQFQYLQNQIKIHKKYELAIVLDRSWSMDGNKIEQAN